MLPMGQQQDQRKQALMKKMQGITDSRGMLGQFSRGNNVYNGGMPNAQSGGGAQFGPPQGNQNAAQALMQQKVAAAQQGGAPPMQDDPQAMLKRQMDQAKSALQMANMQTQRRTTEQNLKAAMERRMNQGGPSAQGTAASKGKAGGMKSLLKRKNDVSAAATRIRNAYTAG